jgi:hypothetical protein
MRALEELKGLPERWLTEGVAEGRCRDPRGAKTECADQLSALIPKLEAEEKQRDGIADLLRQTIEFLNLSLQATGNDDALKEMLADERDNALELAATVADKHWPESGHVQQEGAISCQMTVSVDIRRLKGNKERSAMDVMLSDAQERGRKSVYEKVWDICRNFYPDVQVPRYSLDDIIHDIWAGKVAEALDRARTETEDG